MGPNRVSKKALVTGATGYIGSRIVRELSAAGWNVHAIVRSDSNAASVPSVAPAAVCHQHDGTTESMLSIVESVKPHIVFHLASLFLAQHRPSDVESLVKSNILFGTQLAEAMAEHSIPALINTGTSWQHYTDAAYDPVCLYAATKQAYEDILGYYTSASSLKVITLKLFDTYGPGDWRPKLFTLLRKTARDGTRLAMSPGEQLIDLVYIDDVVRAFSLAADRLLTSSSGNSEVFAVSSGSPVSLKTLVETYARITGKTLHIEWSGRPYRPREVMIPWRTGRLLPGWKPAISLEEGIRRMETQEH